MQRQRFGFCSMDRPGKEHYKTSCRKRRSGRKIGLLVWIELLFRISDADDLFESRRATGGASTETVCSSQFAPLLFF